MLLVVLDDDALEDVAVVLDEEVLVVTVFGDVALEGVLDEEPVGVEVASPTLYTYIVPL